MLAATCHRICRSRIPSSNHKILHPKHRRLISTTPQNAQDPAISPAPAEPRPTFTGRPSKKGEVRTSGRLGSPDYIPRKRGYAPHMPIPARKFNLPSIKHPKGMSDPQKQAPEGKKARDIKTIGIEYERQLNAMRRGYVQWRYQTRKAKLDKKHENAARPHPPRPPPFKPTFAEEMAEPSSTNQLAVERRLFANVHAPQHRRVRGAGYQSAHHQAFLARQRRNLINDYLALYHTSYNFITTPESLDSEILRNFQDTYIGMEASRPQSYTSILRDAEHGTTGDLFDGYISLMNREKENELHNAMMGTVGEGKPGYDEVVREIESAFGNEPAEVENDRAVLAEETGVERSGRDVFVAEQVVEEGRTAIEEKHFARDDLSLHGEADKKFSESVNGTGSNYDWHAIVQAGQPPAVISPEVSADESPFPETKSPGLENGINPSQVKQTTEQPSQKTELDEDIRLSRIQHNLQIAMREAGRLVPRTYKGAPDWEPLRENYRNGFSNVIAPPSLPSFITSYTGPDDISDSDDTLQFPSDIETAIAKSAPSKELPSIVDQAASYYESINPQALSRREIIDAAIKRSEEGVKASKFPELSALVTDDEKSLEYTVIQQEFENEFPARIARQATDVAAWEAAYQKPGVTGDTLGEIPSVESLNADGESTEVGELGPPPERETLRTEFASDLDELQIKALEEIRARREKQGRK